MPKWMREATYDRKLEEIFAAAEIVYAHMTASSIGCWADDSGARLTRSNY